MKRMTAMLSVASAVVLMTAGVLAQAKPNFAGTWTMDAPAAPAAPPAGAPAGGGGGGRGGGRGGGGWGMELTIAQDANSLTIDGMAAGAPQKYVFKLDGSESKNMVAGRGGGAPTEQVSKAVWTGNTLVITTTGANGDTKRVLSLAAGKLSIETTAPGRDGGPGMPTTVTYSKK
jgi:hypothetical protein